MLLVVASFPLQLHVCVRALSSRWAAELCCLAAVLAAAHWLVVACVCVCVRVRASEQMSCLLTRTFKVMCLLYWLDFSVSLRFCLREQPASWKWFSV